MCVVVLATCNVALRAQNNQPCAVCDVLKGYGKKKPMPVAQTTPKNTSKATPKAKAEDAKESAAPVPSVAEVNALRDLVAAQQAELEAQRQQLDQLKQQMQQVLDAVQQANSATCGCARNRTR